MTIKVLEEYPDPICLFTLMHTMFTYNHIHLYYLKLKFNIDIYVFYLDHPVNVVYLYH